MKKKISLMVDMEKIFGDSNAPVSKEFEISGNLFKTN